MSFEEFRNHLLEVDPDYWLVNEDEDLNSVDEVQEFFETGSLTIEVWGRKFVISIQVQEES